MTFSLDDIWHLSGCMNQMVIVSCQLWPRSERRLLRIDLCQEEKKFHPRFWDSSLEEPLVPYRRILILICPGINLQTRSVGLKTEKAMRMNWLV
jgi:hypothetical protein